MKVVLSGYETEYSRTLLLRSVLRTGLSIYKSQEIIKNVKKKLKNRKKVDAEELYRICLKMIKEHGTKYSKKYEIWHKYNHLRRKKKAPSIIIAMGGASVSGKSVTMSDISFRLMLPRIITTDIIRKFVKNLVTPDELKILNASSFEKMKERGKRKKFYIFMKQAEILTPYIRRLMYRAIKDNEDIAIEGIHLVPGMLPRKLLKKPNIISAIIYAPSKTHKHMFFTKTIKEGRPIDKKRRIDFQRNEKISLFLKKRARKYNIPVIKFKNFEQATNDMLDLITKRINKLITVK